MTDDQAIRLQCLDLAVKAGTPWNRLTETADMLTAYVRGVSVAVRDDSTAAMRDDGPADKGVAVEETMPASAWRFPAYVGDPSYSKTLAAVEAEMAKGEPVEEVDRQPLDAIYRANPEALARLRERGGQSIEVNEPDRGEPVEEPQPIEAAIAKYLDQSAAAGPGVANDPRLPTVTM